MSDDSSMFVHSLKKLSISPQDYYVNILFSENIEEITFTSPIFELFSNQKGLEFIIIILIQYPGGSIT